ncbi:MAG: glycosyltransferase family 2 protein [Candidatus Binataceae bacterium]
MKPEISVVVPTYNRRVMVREAITSVLAQRNVRLELIVVDDGSTDGTFAALTTLASSREAGSSILMRLIRTANRGVAAARNTGSALASAPLLAFLDSDDLWMPNKLARQAMFMLANPHFMICQTQELWLRDGRRVNPGRRHLKHGGDIFLDSLRTCLVSPSAVMLRTDLFRGVGGFDETMRAAEDYDLWLRILLAHPIELLDEIHLIRRAGHFGQLSVTIPALDRFRILALSKLLCADLTPIRRRAVCEVLRKKCQVYAGGLRRRGRDREAAFFAALATRAQAYSQSTCSVASAPMVDASLIATMRDLVASPSPAPVYQPAAPL